MPQSEPSLALVSSMNDDVVALAYHDYFDEFQGDGSFKHTRPSLMGLSASSNFGASWSEVPKLRPAADCPDSWCLGALMGDPWLAASGTTLYHIMLANMVSGPLGPAAPSHDWNNNAVAVARYTLAPGGNLTFSDVRTLEFSTGTSTHDKTMIDSFNGHLAATWLFLHANPDYQRVRVAYSSDGDTWDIQDWVVDYATLGDRQPMNPIIRIVDATRAYLFVQGRFNSSDPNAMRYFVFRLTRTGAGTPWSAQEIFARTFNHRVFYDGATIHGTNTVSTFRNWINADFEVLREVGARGAGIHRLWLATSAFVPSRAEVAVRLFDCRDASLDPPDPTCWQEQHFGDMVFGPQDADGEAAQIFPEVSARPGEPDPGGEPHPEVRVTWYRHAGNDLAGQPLDSRSLTAQGVRSTDGGQGWTTPPKDLSVTWGLDDSFDGPVPALLPARERPCSGRADQYGNIGDYSSTLLLPASKAITAYAFSRAEDCSAAPFHEVQIEATTW